MINNCSKDEFNSQTNSFSHKNTNKRYFMLMDFLYPIILDNNKSIFTTRIDKSMKKYLKNFEFLSLNSNLKILVVYYCNKEKLCAGRFLIVTNDIKIAEKVANIIINYCFIERGRIPNSLYGYLPFWELDDVPNIEWQEEDLIKSIKFPEVNSPRELDLFSGIFYFEDFYEPLKKIIPAIMDNLSLCEAFNYLSRSLFHYNAIDVKLEEIKYGLEENEYSMTYLKDVEDAYFNAFKGLENFFGQKQIKKNTIKEAFKRVNYKNITPTRVWKQNCMEICQECHPITYQELLRQFVDIRNTKVGHGNKKRYYIRVEDLCKIQRFLNDLVIDAIEEKIKNLIGKGV